MSKNKKTAVMVICLIVVIALVVFFVTRGTKDEDKDTNTGKVDEQVEEPVEENVNVLNDGTKLNTSSNLHKTKTIEGMEISDIQLTENNNVTLLLGTVKNTSSTEQGGYFIDIKILDKTGEEITTFPGYIRKLQPGETAQLSVNQTIDCANAYDFTVSKAQ